MAPVQELENRFLVVDGLINVGNQEVSVFNLSRTRPIQDSLVDFPEENARVVIEDDIGNQYSLEADNAVSGRYISNPLTLSAERKYGLRIETADGKRYESEKVVPVESPAIDSIVFAETPNLEFYLYSSDPSNSARYFRWQFEETFQTRAQTPSFWAVVNGIIEQANEDTQTESCWITQSSTNLLIGNSVELSSAVISRFPLHAIPKPDKRLSIRYSIEVTQFALTQDAYQYFQIIKRNSEEIGGIFDPMPSQLKGNIFNVSNRNEPVIGFVSAGKSSKRRIFIARSDLNDWPFITTGYDCEVIGAASNPSDYRIYNYPDTSYTFWYFSSGQPPGLVLSKKKCIDCRLSGGTNSKPSFW